MMINKKWKLQKVHSSHARSSCWEVDDSSLRDSDRLIYSHKVITDDYDCVNDNEEQVDIFKEG